ncbi:MAG: phosphoadenylyl-sulfate reductase [Nitratireductor sp.]|nr:phosphoadenylyl-sulfate reductase [Nitratireductor sp.]
MQPEFVHEAEPRAANDTVASRVASFNLDHLEASAKAMLADALQRETFGKAAVVTSFGAESAVLLHLVAAVKPDAPVLFIDTRMMFQETLDYQLELTRHLGLTNVQVISRDSAQLRREDVFGRLHLKDTDACCHLRKVVPLEEALAGYGAWVTGRKRFQSANRATLKPFDHDAAGRVKLNPLSFWEQADIEACFIRHSLPRHPLVSDGFTSIGCAPCTRLPADKKDPRSGRWAGEEKTECGIHIVGGQIVRANSQTASGA